MILSEVIAYTGREPFSSSTRDKAPGLTCKHLIRLKRPAKDNTNLSDPFISYREKGFGTIGPGVESGGTHLTMVISHHSLPIMVFNVRTFKIISLTVKVIRLVVIVNDFPGKIS